MLPKHLIAAAGPSSDPDEYDEGPAEGPSSDPDEYDDEPDLELTAVPSITKVKWYLTGVRCVLVLITFQVSGSSSPTVGTYRRGEYRRPDPYLALYALS